MTGLELIIILIIIVGAGAILMVYLAGGEVPDWAHSFPGGLVAESMYITGDSLQPVGSVIGFSEVSGTYDGTAIQYPCQDPGRLGSAEVLVSLFMGDTGAIDMDHLNVTWNAGGSFEQISRSDTPPLVCPNWTITKKYNMLPGLSADGDNWLEPNEQFMILACPSQTIAPYQSFTLTLQPDGVAVPLPLTRMAPAQIQPVMDLG
jgi:hypothetical protein